jgi:hypothetical protein
LSETLAGAVNDEDHVPMRRTLLIGITGVLAFVMSSRAAPPAPPATQPEGKPQTGTFSSTFTDRSPLSAPAELRKRVGEATAAAGGVDYDLS